MKKIVYIMLLIFLIPNTSLAAGPRVLVSIPPVAWFVEQVAGDLVQVQVMVPPGASPHAYEPKPRQMTAVAQADLYLAVGVEFENSWLPRFMGLNPRLAVKHLDAGITKLPMAEHGHEEHGHGHSAMSHEAEEDHHDAGHEAELEEHGAPHDYPAHDSAGEEHRGLDPHIWLSPRLAAIIVGNIRDALSEIDPENGPVYAANASRTLIAIEALQGDFTSLFRELPSRRFLVFHPSWGYFAHEFGLEQLPIEVQGREPSPRELHDLVHEAIEHGVRAVFVQPQMSRRTAQIVANELGGSVVLADPLAADWDANLRRVAHELSAAMKEEH